MDQDMPVPCLSRISMFAERAMVSGVAHSAMQYATYPEYPFL